MACIGPKRRPVWDWVRVVGVRGCEGPWEDMHPGDGGGCFVAVKHFCSFRWWW